MCRLSPGSVGFPLLPAFTGALKATVGIKTEVSQVWGVFSACTGLPLLLLEAAQTGQR